MSELTENLKSVLNSDPDRLDKAALLIARLEYPDLRMEECIQRLDEIAASVAAKGCDPDEPFLAVNQINQELYEVRGFKGNSKDYYDPRNSFLNDVLTRNTGIPISLSLVYIEIVALTLVSAIFVIIVVGAPGWAFLTYGLLSVRLLKSTFEPPAAPMRRLLPFSWLGAYLAAWPIAVVQAMEAYTRLSTKPPDCYVCSAAAHGHAWFVGAKTVLSQEGHRVRMNRQMVVLKMAELALKAIVPTLHQRLRITYDRIGPPLARRIRHPLMADLAYLSLKPIEWITLIFIRIYLLLRQHRPASAAARSHRRRGVWGI